MALPGENRPGSIYDLPVFVEVLIAAAALNLLLALVHHQDLGYWTWSFRSKSKRDKFAFLVLVLAQVVIVSLITMILPLVHEAIGIRPVDELAGWFLIGEALVAGWAAVTLVPRASSEPDSSITTLFAKGVWSAVSALDRRAEPCVRPVLEREMDSNPTRRGQVLSAFRDSVGQGDKTAANLIVTSVDNAWQNQDERRAALDALTDYVIERRMSPQSLLAKR